MGTTELTNYLAPSICEKINFAQIESSELFERSCEEVFEKEKPRRVKKRNALAHAPLSCVPAELQQHGQLTEGCKPVGTDAIEKEEDWSTSRFYHTVEKWAPSPESLEPGCS